MTMERRRRSMSICGLVALVVCVPGLGLAQAPQTVDIRLPGGEEQTLSVHEELGIPSISVAAMEALGWVAEPSPSLLEAVVLSNQEGRELHLRAGSPILMWDGRAIHMVDAPYESDGVLYIPLQIAVDLLPALLPEGYRFDTDAGAIFVGSAEAPLADAPTTGLPPGATGGTATNAQRDLGGAEPPRPFTPEDGEYTRLVVIDPGHGGDDPGAIGPGGEEEKNVALSVSLALAQELAKRPGTEVRLTRDRDVKVPVWARGEWATEWRGDRPAVFLSIHANALPDRSGVRGFETYFLSEARTDHERRVAAAENAATQEPGGLELDDPLLGEILRDLRAYDHQEWSALLAQEIQQALGEFHPGPDRGVKQGPLAVITNSLMPSALVEIGFISNREEARAMEGIAFRRAAAENMAAAIDRFFERYAPEEPSF